MDANVQESQLTRCARVHKHPHMELSLLLITKRQKVLDRIFVAEQVVYVHRRIRRPECGINAMCSFMCLVLSPFFFAHTLREEQ